MRRFLLVLAGVIAAGYAVYSVVLKKSFPESYVLVAQSVITMEPDAIPANAVLVRGGEIEAVGAIERLDPYGSLPRVEYPGATILPGFVEPHTHPVAAALLSTAIDISSLTHSSRAEVMAALHEAASERSLTPWIIAFGWDPVALEDLSPPTLQELDAISPDKPLLVLTQMMHDAYVNTAALEAMGTPNRSHILREIEEIALATSTIPAPKDAVVELLLRKQYQTYSAAGYTSIGVTGAVGRHSDPVGLLQRLSFDERPMLRSFVYLLPDQVADYPLGGNQWFSVVGEKFWLDGSPFTGAAATAEPYAETPLTQMRLGLGAQHSGELMQERAELMGKALAAQKRGAQLAFHVQGERAVDLALDAIDAAQTAHPRPALSHRLEHNALITEQQLNRARQLGVSTGFFVDHLTLYGNRLSTLFGEERQQRYMPIGSALERGVLVTLHGDHPATPVDALRVLQAAVLRHGPDSVPVGPAQALTTAQALRAMTVDAARQLGQEDHIGSLKPGKRADMIVLSQNPLEVAPKQLTDILVLETVVDGQPTDMSWLGWAKPGLLLRAAWQMVAGSPEAMQ